MTNQVDDILNNRPTFLSGLASIMDWSGSAWRSTYTESGVDANTAALASDWAAVGEDFETALKQIESEQCKDS